MNHQSDPTGAHGLTTANNDRVVLHGFIIIAGSISTSTGRLPVSRRGWVVSWPDPNLPLPIAFPSAVDVLIRYRGQSGARCSFSYCFPVVAIPIDCHLTLGWSINSAAGAYANDLICSQLRAFAGGPSPKPSCDHGRREICPDVAIQQLLKVPDRPIVGCCENHVSLFAWGVECFTMDELPRIRLCRFLVGAGVFCAGVVALQFVAHPAGAESLREALVTAYTANPELDAERARQRATDEAVPQALSGARPTVAATGEIGSERTWSRSLTTPPAAPGIVRSTSTSDPGAISLSFSQPLFRGFRTYTGTASAEANVRAGRYALGNVEQNVLLNAVTAYVDVVRDQALVRLTQNNLSTLR